ncbi:MAG: hypothetical protein Kow0098_16530 [Ignavibacteriaceae bacterium]
MRKFFYFIKPFIPRRIQILLRRKLVRIQLEKYADLWPILQNSDKSPDWWPGWGDGKKFAFILTHDVELQSGHDKVLQLMETEKELGFRSSFNFVPERYNVSSKIRETLIANGFEVGVHGLNHDGKLFQNETIFRKRAQKINNYLKEWNSVGFRAPAMHHNLDLIGELNIKYDLSTFDTDPFEPQSDGVGTIFPFRVSSENINGGYWEFPYTLVQDFTLFILMQKTNKIWKDKLDWIAEKGGMALLNVHPDYISFSKKEKNYEKFDIQQYIDFLNYVKSKYKNQYWNPLPKELAEYLSMKLQTNA